MSTARLKVMTINTHKGFSYFNRRFILPELKSAIQSMGADVVFMQEVLGEHTEWARNHASQWPVGAHYEYLADDVWPQYSYGKNAVYPQGHHGNALLSRYPIEDWDNHAITYSDAEQRGLLYNRIVLSEKHSVHLICAHFSLQERKRTNEIRHLDAVLKKIPKNEPVVIAGDFNDWFLKSHRKILKMGFHEALEHAYGKPGRTFPALLPLVKLDRIYVKNAESVAPVVLPASPWSHLSDHRPLMADVVIPLNSD